MYTIYNTMCLLICVSQLPRILGADDTNFNKEHPNDFSKGKRGVGSVVDSVQGVHSHSIPGTVGAHGIHGIPIAVPVHIPVPRPYPVAIPKPIGVPVGVPVAVRVAVPKPYPVPVLLDQSSADYGFGLYGHDYNHLLNYLTKSTHAHNHLAHLANHDQHSLANYVISKLIH